MFGETNFRPPPYKRARIAGPSSSTSTSTPASHFSFLIPSTTPSLNAGVSTQTNAPKLTGSLPQCASCRRVFVNSRLGTLVSCALCHSPTCTICARTCSMPPPSVPPTPSLSFSLATTPSPRLPTRSASSSPPAPPALRLSWRFLSPNTGEGRSESGAVDHSDVVKRRRRGVAEEREEVEGVGGCGRVVCKGCCYENTQGNGGATCLPCYGHPYDVESATTAGNQTGVDAASRADEAVTA